MRAYGKDTDILIDRDREATSHLVCAKNGLAPPLLARFKNGLLYRFIPGDVCTPQDLVNEQVWRPVARRLGQWHATLPIDALTNTNGVDGNQSNGESKGIAERRPTPNIWATMRRWVNALPQDNAKQQARKKFLEQELERSFTDLDNTDGPGRSGFIFGHCVSVANPLCLPVVLPYYWRLRNTFGARMRSRLTRSDVVFPSHPLLLVDVLLTHHQRIC